MEEMATALRAQANLFEALNDPRIKYDTDGWEDDYHHFYTDDETIAEKFGFNEITDEDLLAELSDRNERRRRASLVLASYMEARARHEGVSYGLDAAFSIRRYRQESKVSSASRLTATTLSFCAMTRTPNFWRAINAATHRSSVGQWCWGDRRRSGLS